MGYLNVNFILLQICRISITWIYALVLERRGMFLGSKFCLQKEKQKEKEKEKHKGLSSQFCGKGLFFCTPLQHSENEFGNKNCRPYVISHIQKLACLASIAIHVNIYIFNCLCWNVRAIHWKAKTHPQTKKYYDPVKDFAGYSIAFFLKA